MVQFLLEAFPILAIKKWLICRKLTFSHFFYSIFFSENTAMRCLLLPNNLEIQDRTRSTLSQSQHSKRLLNVIAHIHTIKHNPFIYGSISNKNKHLSLILVTIYWTSASLFHWDSGSHTYKIALAIKECKIFPLVLLKTGGKKRW